MSRVLNYYSLIIELPFVSDWVENITNNKNEDELDFLYMYIYIRLYIVITYEDI